MSRPARLLPALLLALAGLASAQDAPPAAPPPPVEEAPVSLEVVVGLGGKATDQGFVPVLVDLTPTDSAPRTVLVQLRQEDEEAPLLTLGPVELSGGVPRRLQGVVSARALSGDLPVLARALEPDGREVGSARIPLEVTSNALLVVVDRRGAAPADLSAVRTRPHGAGGEQRWSNATVASPGDLPHNPLGYSGVGAVLLGDLELPEWGEAEARALAAWVTRGGHLVVSVGQRASLLTRSLLGRSLSEALAPLPDQEPRRSVGVRGLFGQLAREAGTAPGGATLARLLPQPARGDVVLLGDDAGEPFLVQHPCGLGRVTLLAADLWAKPFLHAPETTALLELALQGGPRHVPRSLTLFDELAQMRQPAQVGTAFAMLIIYALVVGPGVYFLLRMRRRGLLVWLVIPAVTCAFTAFVPFYRLALKDAESTVVGVRLLEARLGSSRALESTDVLLFSGSPEVKHLVYRGEDAVAFGMEPPRRLGSGQPRLGAALGAGPAAVEVDLPVALWGTRYVAFEATAPAPAITGRVELTTRDSAARLHVEHRGRFVLRDPVLLYPSFVGVLASPLASDLSPGQALEQVELTAPTLAGGYSAGGKELHERIIDSLLSARLLPELQERQTAFLIGHTEVPTGLEATPNVRIRALPTVVVIELEVGYLDGIPFGSARSQREASTIARVGSNSVQRQVLTRTDLPSAPRDLRLLRLRLRGTTQALVSTRLEVYAPAEDVWDTIPLDHPEVERDPTAPGRAMLDLSSPPATGELPDPARWLPASPPHRLLFRQTFQRADPGEDAPYVFDLDLSLEWPPPPGVSLPQRGEGEEAPDGEPPGPIVPPRRR